MASPLLCLLRTAQHTCGIRRFASLRKPNNFHQLIPNHSRHICSTRPKCRAASTAPFSQSPEVVKAEHQSNSTSPKITHIYDGPLAKTFRTLKIFSLSSFGLATALTPFMFIVESSLPFVARCALAATAIITSGVSTTLVAWCGKPYVVALRTIALEESSAGDLQVQPASAIQLETSTLLMKPRYTTVYDIAFLKETKRPFAKWELADSVVLNEKCAGGSEETIAETSDKEGRVLGRWIVTWSNDGMTGNCRAAGPVTKYFNVHEELLPASLRQ